MDTGKPMIPRVGLGGGLRFYAERHDQIGRGSR